MQNPNAPNDNVTKFRELATKTAEILGFTVLANPSPSGNPAYVEIAGPDDAKLSMYLRSDGGQFRVFVNGLFPRIENRPYSPQRKTRITLALETKPAHVAGHIRRRLLPMYLEQLKEATKRRLESEERQADRELAIQKLLDAGARLVNRDDGHLTIDTRDDDWERVCVAHDGTIELDLRRLSPDEALAIIGVLRA